MSLAKSNLKETQDSVCLERPQTLQGCWKLLKAGGGPNGAAKLGGQVGGGGANRVLYPLQDVINAFFHQV